jgi:hypothetical protein
MASALFFRNVGNLFMEHLMKVIAINIGIPNDGEFENFEDFYDIVTNEREKADGIIKDLLDSLAPVVDKYDLSKINKHTDEREYMHHVISLELEIGTNLFNCVRYVDSKLTGIGSFVFERVSVVLDCEDIYMKNEYEVYSSGNLIVTVEHKKSKIGSVSIAHVSDNINIKRLGVSSTSKADHDAVEQYGIPVLLLVLLTIGPNREFWESFRFQSPYMDHTALELFNKYTNKTRSQQK